VARIAQKSVETIKHQVNLVDLVSPYVELKRAGSSWKGLSPFTQEKTPSFYVHPDLGFYKCISTGEGGDCFTFIMKVENLEFPEAIEFIAKKFNITLEYEAGGPSREEMSTSNLLSPKKPHPCVNIGKINAVLQCRPQMKSK
jgi:DNA primase